MSENETHVIYSSSGDLSPQEYAEAKGITIRTVRRWLADGELPTAWQDALTGKWNIPSDAERVVSAAPRQVQQRPPAFLLPHGGAAPVGAGEMVLHQPAAAAAPEREPTRLEDLDDEPAFLSIPVASEYLGIPQAQILAQPELFGVMHVGINSSPRVPKATIKKFEG